MTHGGRWQEYTVKQTAAAESYLEKKLKKLKLKKNPEVYYDFSKMETVWRLNVNAEGN